jgi:site-specific DNA recombinase
MKAPSIRPVRCAIYTRVSTEYGLDQEFNSLDAQYDAASAYIKSQAHAGWTLIRSRYDDGGYSGGSTDRPDLQRLLDDIRARKLDVIVVYKVDRLTRSLADFAKLVELFDAHSVSFVSVTGPKGRALHKSAPGPTSPVRFQHRVHGRESRNH